MSQIYIAAAIVTLAALGLWNWLVQKFPPKFPRHLLWLAFFLCLPLEPLSVYLLRYPLMHWTKAQLPDIFPYLVLCWAPLTEDTFKLLPLLIPAIRRQLNRDNYAQLALAIGIGFGIGEAWFLAYVFAQDPKIGGYPFYYYGGFLGERLQVCILHAYFTSFALRRWGNKFALGLASAMSIHFLLNSPIILVRFLPHPEFMLGLYSVALIFITFFAASQLAKAIMGPINLVRLMLGRARCPECQQIYDRPLLAFNLGPKRYEPCPHCKKWHLTGEAETVHEAT